MRTEVPWAICLMGPTASGKTALAVELVRRYPLDIISVDSAMVYQRMDIGTGKPGPEVLAIAPHRLVDVRDPSETYSAGDFARDAGVAIREVVRAGRVPLLVGGTMLYFRSLLQGLSPLPQRDPETRAEIDRQAEAVGWPALHAELAGVDPVAAARIGPMDRQRIQRALEVYRLTGRPISALQGEEVPPQEIARFMKIALLPPDRAWLHERIARRLDGMLARGFLKEVAGLRAMPVMHLDRPSMRAVGYRQLWRHLAGEYDSREANERALVATRQLARRQLTWLRAEVFALRFDAGVASLSGDVARALDSSPVAGALSAASG